MLRREDCEAFEKILHKEIASRQQLGGYSPESMTILLLCQIAFELMRHIRETEKPTKSKKTKKTDDD